MYSFFRELSIIFPEAMIINDVLYSPLNESLDIHFSFQKTNK